MDFKENNDPEKKPVSVLITGSSGLVGKNLTSLLLKNGYKVSHLSRKRDPGSRGTAYFWDPDKQSVDPEAFEGVNYLIHLAGANIGEKRWTTGRREEIINSRVNTARLLFKAVTENNVKLQAFISASAIGYYGTTQSDLLFNETCEPATDFLGQTCRLWEESADMFAGAGIRTVKIRTGIVLDKKEGVLSKLFKPAKLGLVIRFGSGRQYMPWIHITDLCSVYLKALADNEMSGAYNAVSPQITDYNHFIGTMAGVMHRPVILPPVPPFVLKLLFGEMSDLIVRGNKVSSKKILAAGFRFSYPDLEMALKNLILND